MAKPFFFSRNKLSIGLTFLGLIFFGAYYYFIYIPDHEQSIQERRFRCLRITGISISQKIENSKVLIANIANSYYEKAKKNDNEGLSQLSAYAKFNSKENFVLLLPKQALRYYSSKFQYIGDDKAGNEFYIEFAQRITMLVKKSSENGIDDKKDLDQRLIGIQFEYAEFFKSFLLSDVFDNYIFFINENKIYEPVPTGLSVSSPDSLLNEKEKFTTPGFYSLRLGENDYKIFSQPIHSYTNDKWVISGLLKSSKYQAQKGQLPASVLMLLLTTVIIIIVSMPWIKIFNMGNRDTLTTNDGVNSLLVSIFLMSLLFLIFFKYVIDVKQSRWARVESASHMKDSYSRNRLASSISSAFVKEMTQVCNLIDIFGKKENMPVANDAVLLGAGKTKTDSIFKKTKKGLDVKEIFWMDGQGRVVKDMTVDSMIAPKGRYNGRDYFISPGAFKIKTDTFGFQHVISYTTGTHSSIFSKKIKETVVAVSCNLRSVNNIVMPEGYQFAIINNAGWVQYHSKIDRSLFEQLNQEFSNRKELQSCLSARSGRSFKTEYYGKTYNVKIEPIPNLPFFVVVFEDAEFKESRDTEAYAFTLSMLICMLIFTTFIYAIIFIFSAKQSLFRKQYFDTSWIGPNDTCRHQYNVSIICNISILVLLVIFFNRCSFLSFLYLLLLSVIFSLLCSNTAFAIKYRVSSATAFNVKIRVILALALLAVILNVVALYHLDLIPRFLLFESAIILPCVATLLLEKKGRIKLDFFKNKWFNKWDYANSYALMITTRLIITSGIPVAFFFMSSFNYEQMLDTRSKQMNFAMALAKKKTYKLPSSGIYSDGYYVANINIPTSPKIADTIKLALQTTLEDTMTNNIIETFRLMLNDTETKNNYLGAASAGNAVFSKPLPRLDNQFPIVTYYPIDSSKYLKIASVAAITYPKPVPTFWLALGVAVFAFHFIIHRIILRLFSLDLYLTTRWQKLDDAFINNNHFNNKVFIIGSPGSHSLDKLILKINQGDIKQDDGSWFKLDQENAAPANAFILDLMSIPADSTNPEDDWERNKRKALAGYGMVIIDRFEYNIKDTEINKIKLDLLETLIEKKIRKVIIISTMHPIIFLDSFKEYQPGSMTDKEVGRWHTLLGHFHVLIDPLVAAEPQEETGLYEKTIMDETRYSRFLHRMQKTSLEYLKTALDDPKNDSKNHITNSLIFKLQLTSQYFYTDIWQSLTIEEKFLLYDLAEDGLVNSYDDFNFNMLISKGLIVKKEGTFGLFNNGFRNFILTAVAAKDIEQIRSLVKDNSRWGDLKTPLSLTIIFILIFVFASEHEQYTKLITYITAFGAGVPAILKIFSMFPGKSNALKTE